MINKERQIVFIVGSGRSGTTLLRSILENDKRNFTVLPELYFFDEVLSYRKTFGDFNKNKKKYINRIIYLIREYSADPAYKKHNIDFEKLRSILEQSNDYKELFLNLVSYFSNDQSEILVEKTPANIFYIDQIREMFPKAIFIHQYRDGRDYCASAHKRKWSKSLEQLCIFWLKSFEEFQKVKGGLSISYEELTIHNRETVAKIYQYLGLEFDENILNSSENIDMFSSFDKTNAKGILPKSHFNQYFNDSQKKIVEYYLFDKLRELGYQTEQKPKINLFSKTKFFLYNLKFNIYIYLKRSGYFYFYENLSKIKR